MTRLLILVEGQSEEAFVKRALAPHLEKYRVYATPTVLWTKRLKSGGGFHGGVSNWRQIHNDLLLLMEDSDAWFSTLLDFYGLPDDFPGLSEISSISDPRGKVVALQERFAAETSHARFIPFLALHEFEAWLFSAPDIVAAHFGGVGEIRLASQIREIVKEAGAPELINHGKDTHPKARLRELVKNYKETSDGATLLEKIGISHIRAACPHFNHWLSTLEQLGASISSQSKVEV